MSNSKQMRTLLGVMAATMTLSIGALCASAQSTTTTDNNASVPGTAVVTANPESGAVLGVSRTVGTDGAGAVAAVVPGEDVPGVLGANRDRSPRTGESSNELLVMLAGASFAGASVLTYIGKRRV